MSAAAIPPSLVTGAVRAWHIVLLYTLFWCSAGVISVKLTPSVDPDFANLLRNTISNAIAASLTVVVALIVPEMRRAIPSLYSAGKKAIAPADAVVFVALMLCWALGASRIAVALPLLEWRPDLYATLGFMERMPAVSSTNLLLIVLGGSVVAPLGEELVFRGFLQNLFMRRWGLWPGILLSAFCFGLIHLQYAPFAMVAGIFFSLLYLKFGTLWPGTVLHALHNLIASFVTLSGTAILVKPRADVTSLSHWIPELVLTAAFIPLLILFWRRFRPTP